MIKNEKGKRAFRFCISFMLIILLYSVPVLAAESGSVIWIPGSLGDIEDKDGIRAALVTNVNFNEEENAAKLFTMLGVSSLDIEYLPVTDYTEAMELVRLGQADIVVSAVDSGKQAVVEQAGIQRYIYHHPIGILTVFSGILFLCTVVLIAYIRIHVKRQSELRGYEKSYRMLADTVGQAGIEYDIQNDRLTVFGQRHGEIDVPEVVERLHEKLKRRALRIALTEEEFDGFYMNIEPDKTYQTEFQCGMKEAGWNWFTLIYIVMFSKEAHHKPIRLIGCLMDAQKQHQAQERLEELGQYDKLTGTLNRAGAEFQMAEALKNLEEYSQNVFLLMDVDWFKQINDNYGHLCGDDVLRVIGENINEIFQGDTIVCRWGGDEFTMFVRGPGAEENLLEKRIEELQRRMKAYTYEGKNYPIGLSIGGVIPIKDMGMEELFKQADDVLYEVKKRGRDSFWIRHASL